MQKLQLDGCYSLTRLVQLMKIEKYQCNEWGGTDLKYSIGFEKRLVGYMAI